MKVFSENKKAFYDYNILERFEAGLVLIGQKLKSVRMDRMALTSFYVVIRNEEAYLIGAKDSSLSAQECNQRLRPRKVKKNCF